MVCEITVVRCVVLSRHEPTAIGASTLPTAKTPAAGMDKCRMQVPAKSPTADYVTLLERVLPDVDHASAVRTGSPSLTSFGVMRQRIHQVAGSLR